MYVKRTGDDITVMEEDLRICLVRPLMDTERRFCFEIISPTKSHILQADTEELYHVSPGGCCPLASRQCLCWLLLVKSGHERKPFVMKSLGLWRRVNNDPYIWDAWVNGIFMSDFHIVLICFGGSMLLLLSAWQLNPPAVFVASTIAQLS